jgi:hypothetical protein
MARRGPTVRVLAEISVVRAGAASDRAGSASQGQEALAVVEFDLVLTMTKSHNDRGLGGAIPAERSQL